MASPYPKLALALRWAARLTSLLSIGVLLLFITGEDGLISPANWAKVRPAEWVALTFFPLGVMLGLVLAWWREWVGASVTLLSLAAFYAACVLQSGRLPVGPWFLIFCSPAFLFFGSWLARGRPRGAPTWKSA
jgi:hypothetical protein